MTPTAADDARSVEGRLEPRRLRDRGMLARALALAALAAGASRGKTTKRDKTAPCGGLGPRVASCAATYARTLSDAFERAPNQTLTRRGLERAVLGKLCDRTAPPTILETSAAWLTSRSFVASKSRVVLGIGPGSTGTRSVLMAFALLGLAGKHYGTRFDPSSCALIHEAPVDRLRLERARYDLGAVGLEAARRPRGDLLSERRRDNVAASPRPLDARRRRRGVDTTPSGGVTASILRASHRGVAATPSGGVTRAPLPSVAAAASPPQRRCDLTAASPPRARARRRAPSPADEILRR